MTQHVVQQAQSISQPLSHKHTQRYLRCTSFSKSWDTKPAEGMASSTANTADAVTLRQLEAGDFEKGEWFD
jgi:hypothetical protein